MVAKVLGRTVLDNLAEWADPSRAAVVVVDMQNDFCHSDGAGANKGRDYTSGRSILPALAGLLAGARKVGVPIFYCVNTQRDDGSLLSAPEIARRIKKSGGDPLLWTIEGSWGHQVVDELKPQPKDFIVRKHRPSAFYQTNLEMLLRLHDRQTVIVTGVGTRGCVESTARDAQLRDFYVLVPADTTASQRPEWYQASMLLAASLYHFTGPVEDILNVWKTADAR